MGEPHTNPCRLMSHCIQAYQANPQGSYSTALSIHSTNLPPPLPYHPPCPQQHQHPLSGCSTLPPKLHYTCTSTPPTSLPFPFPFPFPSL